MIKTVTRPATQFLLVFRCPECGQVTSRGEDFLRGSRQLSCDHCRTPLDEDDLAVLPETEAARVR